MEVAFKLVQATMVATAYYHNNNTLLLLNFCFQLCAPSYNVCPSSYNIDQGHTADVQARTTKEYIMERIPQAQGIHARVSSSDKNLGAVVDCTCACAIIYYRVTYTKIKVIGGGGGGGSPLLQTQWR